MKHSSPIGIGPVGSVHTVGDATDTVDVPGIRQKLALLGFHAEITWV